MAFTGNEDHKIPIDQAAEMNRRFRKAYSSQPKGVYYSRETLLEILNQDTAVGIRFYFALDADNKMKLTFVGVDENENDLLTIVGDGGMVCPPACGTVNVLNS